MVNPDLKRHYLLFQHNELLEWKVNRVIKLLLIIKLTQIYHLDNEHEEVNAHVNEV